MNKLEILAEALEYIEQHLQSDIKTEDVAAACFCSKSALDKMFNHLNRISVHEYLKRRRMMLAAKTIVSKPEESLLDIALACGYSTNESFSRAFKSVWNCNPSEFRSNTRFSELFPRILPPSQKTKNGGTYISMRRNVDISELYELFMQRKNCYFVCCDIRSLSPINVISRKAGDLAILETLNRMEAEAGDDDIVFRIGGDEFTILTDSTDIKYAEAVCERIRIKNGKPIVFDGQEIPIMLHTAIVKVDSQNMRYSDVFEKLHTAIKENKE